MNSLDPDKVNIGLGLGWVGKKTTVGLNIEKTPVLIGTTKLGKGKDSAIIGLQVSKEVREIKLSLPNPEKILKDVFREGEPCFLAGTKITLKDRTQKNIEDIKIHDELTSYDLEQNTLTSASATELHKRLQDHYYTITLENGKAIKVTEEHPFYVEDTWLKVKHLKPGMSLFTPTGKKVTITSITRNSQKVEVYNLTVDTYNNYFVEDVLVHNKGGGPEDSGVGSPQGFVSDHALTISPEGGTEIPGGGEDIDTGKKQEKAEAEQEQKPATWQAVIKARSIYSLAVISDLIGKDKKAIEYYEKAMDIDPSLAPQCYESIGDIHIDQKDYAKAKEMYVKAESILSQQPEADQEKLHNIQDKIKLIDSHEGLKHKVIDKFEARRVAEKYTTQTFFDINEDIKNFADDIAKTSKTGHEFLEKLFKALKEKIYYSGDAGRYTLLGMYTAKMVWSEGRGDCNEQTHLVKGIFNYILSNRDYRYKFRDIKEVAIAEFRAYCHACTVITVGIRVGSGERWKDIYFDTVFKKLGDTHPGKKKKVTDAGYLNDLGTIADVYDRDGYGLVLTVKEIEKDFKLGNYRKALEKSKSSIEYWNRKGFKDYERLAKAYTYYSDKSSSPNYKKAAKYYQKAIKRFKSQVLDEVLDEEYLSDKNKLPGEDIDVKCTMAELKVKLGKAYYNSGDFKKAFRAFEEAQEILPSETRLRDVYIEEIEFHARDSIEYGGGIDSWERKRFSKLTSQEKFKFLVDRSKREDPFETCELKRSFKKTVQKLNLNYLIGITLFKLAESSTDTKEQKLLYEKSKSLLKEAGLVKGAGLGELIAPTLPSNRLPLPSLLGSLAASEYTPQDIQELSDLGYGYQKGTELGPVQLTEDMVFINPKSVEPFDQKTYNSKWTPAKVMTDCVIGGKEYKQGTEVLVKLTSGELEALSVDILDSATTGNAPSKLGDIILNSKDKNLINKVFNVLITMTDNEPSLLVLIGQKIGILKDSVEVLKEIALTSQDKYVIDKAFEGLIKIGSDYKKDKKALQVLEEIALVSEVPKNTYIKDKARHSLFASVHKRYKGSSRLWEEDNRISKRLASEDKDPFRFGSKDIAIDKSLLARANKLNINAIDRFEWCNNEKILREIIENRENTTPDGRKLAVAIFASPEADVGGAVDDAISELAGLMRYDYRVMYYEVSNVEEFYSSLKESTAKQKASALFIAGHGQYEDAVHFKDGWIYNSGNITFGAEDYKSSVLTWANLKDMKKLSSSLEEEGVVILNSCKQGYGEKKKRNTANLMRAVFPQASKIYAPIESFRMINLEFDNFGNIVDVDFINNPFGGPIPKYIAQIPAQLGYSTRLADTNSTLTEQDIDQLTLNPGTTNEKTIKVKVAAFDAQKGEYILKVDEEISFVYNGIQISKDTIFKGKWIDNSNFVVSIVGKLASDVLDEFTEKNELAGRVRGQGYKIKTFNEGNAYWNAITENNLEGIPLSDRILWDNLTQKAQDFLSSWGVKTSDISDLLSAPGEIARRLADYKAEDRTRLKVDIYGVITDTNGRLDDRALDALASTIMDIKNPGKKATAIENLIDILYATTTGDAKAQAQIISVLKDPTFKPILTKWNIALQEVKGTAEKLDDAAPSTTPSHYTFDLTSSGFADAGDGIYDFVIEGSYQLTITDENNHATTINVTRQQNPDNTYTLTLQEDLDEKTSIAVFGVALKKGDTLTAEYEILPGGILGELIKVEPVKKDQVVTPSAKGKKVQIKEGKWAIPLEGKQSVEFEGGHLKNAKVVNDKGDVLYIIKNRKITLYYIGAGRYAHPAQDKEHLETDERGIITDYIVKDGYEPESNKLYEVKDNCVVAIDESDPNIVEYKKEMKAVLIRGLSIILENPDVYLRDGDPKIIGELGRFKEHLEKGEIDIEIIT
ncbi:MAG: hypothetical protein H8D54_02680, partial [Candidatus Omnitrophica bacterium]|nr:hypothetical protein [Candidatus Omnitrophota bacterium]